MSSAYLLKRNVPSRRNIRHRRGATLILTVAMMFMLFSFLAFGIDTGYLSQSRAEIRRTADAAALAGCWELYEQLDAGQTAAAAMPQVRLACADMAGRNPVCRLNPQLDTSVTTQEISIGYTNDIRAANITANPADPYFAVRVTVNKNAERNGEVPFFFGRIFGASGQAMQAQATAIMARQIRGFSMPPTGDWHVDVLPFALDQDTWNALLANNAEDSYRYNPADQSVTGGSDGVLEVNLYPQGTGSPGNRGTVDIGGANNSTSDIARQIVHGISADDLAALGKPLVLDGDGVMSLNGDTGISAGVKDELASIIGQKRIIPIFSSVSGNGNNANYTIVKWVGVRIMDVRLTGKMSGKKLVVQPAPVLARWGVSATSGTSWSDNLLSPVMLAR